jgi:hypothetical protein
MPSQFGPAPTDALTSLAAGKHPERHDEVWTKLDNLAAGEVAAPATGRLAAGTVGSQLAQLDIRALFVNVKAAPYNAVGDGLADDTAAIQAAIDAVEAAGGGVVFFPAGTYIITASLTIDASSVHLVGAGRGVSKIHCSTAGVDLIRLDTALTNALSFLRFADLTIRSLAGAGNVILTVGSVGQSKFERLNLIQNNDGASIYRQTGSAGMYDCAWTDSYFEHKLTATVPGFFVQVNGNFFNDNQFERLRAQYSGAFFFHIEQTAAGTYLYGNTLRNINFEICNGGAVKLLSNIAAAVEDCQLWDNGTSTQHMWYIGKSTGPNSRGITLSRLIRTGGTLGTGLFDIFVGAGEVAGPFTIDSCIGLAGPGVNHNLNGQAVLITGSSANATFTNESTSFSTRVQEGSVRTPVLHQSLASGRCEIDGALDHDGSTAGFYGVAPVARPTALTAADVSVVDTTYGAEEAAVLGNVRTRVNELETKLRALGLLT